jgi:hypothetical protein
MKASVRHVQESRTRFRIHEFAERRGVLNEMRRCINHEGTTADMESWPQLTFN